MLEIGACAGVRRVVAAVNFDGVLSAAVEGFPWSLSVPSSDWSDLQLNLAQCLGFRRGVFQLETSSLCPGP